MRSQQRFSAVACFGSAIFRTRARMDFECLCPCFKITKRELQFYDLRHKHNRTRLTEITSQQETFVWSCGPAFEAVAKFSGCRGFPDFMHCSVSKLIKQLCKYDSEKNTKTGRGTPLRNCQLDYCSNECNSALKRMKS